MQFFCIPHLLTPRHNSIQKQRTYSVLGNIGCWDGSSESEKRNDCMERQIIIVASNAQFRSAFKHGCSGLGCRVETVDTVDTALEIAVHRQVCVLVADVSIQDVGDGLGLAKAIHDQNPDAQCFLVVDEEFSDVLSSAENEPWLRFVHKPIPILRFAADVVEAIKESKVGD